MFDAAAAQGEEALLWRTVEAAADDLVHHGVLRNFPAVVLISVNLLICILRSKTKFILEGFVKRYLFGNGKLVSFIFRIWPVLYI